MGCGESDACRAWRLLVKFFFAQREHLSAGDEFELSPIQCHVLPLIEPRPPVTAVDAAKPSPAETARIYTYRGRDTRLKTPRIAPIAAKDWTPEQKAAAAAAHAGDGSNDNFRTAIHNPALAKAWWDWLRFV